MCCLYSKLCVFAPPDVFVVSSTGRYYRLRREDVSENVSLLLCRQGQSSDQRKPFTRDLPVSPSSALINNPFAFEGREMNSPLLRL